MCLEENPSNWTSSGTRCAPKFDMDWNKISDCATSQEGIDYVVEMAEATENLNPKHICKCSLNALLSSKMILNVMILMGGPLMVPCKRGISDVI